MPAINRIAAFTEDMTAWRRHLHANPELSFDCHKTAAFVAERLREFGITEIHEGIAETGIVAIIEGETSGPTIGLRADMDALPMQETTGADHASTVPGKMHACGHDGHTTMLLGAARYLAETRRFAGRVALIFQPAEEQGGGGVEMVNEGIMDRFGISEVYALHTSPFHEAGTFNTSPGPIMAAVDEFSIDIQGRGGHGAYPQRTADPVAAALQLGQAIQTIIGRNVGALEQAVVSLTKVVTGTAHNVIPDTAHLGGTIRTYSQEVRDLIKARMEEICAGTALAMRVEVSLEFPDGLGPTINHDEQTAKAVAAASEIAGEDKVEPNAPPRTGGEDFGAMLEARPGAFMFIGQGLGPSVHHPEFDFNDEIAPLGASYFARLVERELPVG
jgi:hippurate hydrolase